MTVGGRAVEAMVDRTWVPSEILGAEGWGRTASLGLLDLNVAVHSDDAAVLGVVEELFAPLIVVGGTAQAVLIGSAGAEDDRSYFVATDEGIVVRTPARTIAFAHLMFELNQRAITHSSAALRMHAAAAVVDGRAVVLPGPMGAGKSTLVAGLVQRGFAYVTDEVVAIDPARGVVRPYPRPCSLGVPPAALAPIPWSPGEAAAQYLGASGFVPADRLGVPAAADVPIGVVVLPTYEPNATTTITPLDPMALLAGVASHTFALGTPGTLATLATLLDGVPGFHLVSGDLDEAVDGVLDVARLGTRR